MLFNKKSKILIWSISIVIILIVSGLTFGKYNNESDINKEIINYDLDKENKYQIIVDNEVEFIPADSIQSVLLMDVNTGEVLASSGDIYKNFEPGSPFKIITAAMALKEDLVDIDDLFNCEGHLDIDGKTLYCWNLKGHGKQTLSQALENKCNIATVEMGLKIGKEKFLENFDVLSFNSETSDENLIIINNTDLATASIGKGFGISPLQMVSSMSALLNGGTLHSPFISGDAEDIIKTEIDDNQQVATRQVVSRDVSDIVVTLLKNISSDNKISGMGGVSDIAPNEKFITSYVATDNVDNPNYVGIIVLNVEAKDKDLAEETMINIINKYTEDL